MFRIDLEGPNIELKNWLRNPLNDDLIFINEKVPTNTELVDLFARTVRKVAGQQRNPFRSSKAPDLQDIVLRVKTQVNAVPAGNGKHLACCDILQDAMRELKGHLKQAKRTRLEGKERTAIENDQREYNLVDQSPPLPPETDITFRVIFMGNPEDYKPKMHKPGPHILKPDRFIKTYTDIIWLLSSDLGIKPQRLHLWARRVNPGIRRYAICPGLYWDHVAGNYPIEGTEFGIVDMNSISHYYTVALVNKSDIEEIPCPIGIPLPSNDICCDLACNSLTAHIESIWEDSKVKHALMLPDNRCVKQIPLNSANFPVFKNELYLKVSERDQ